MVAVNVKECNGGYLDSEGNRTAAQTRRHVCGKNEMRSIHIATPLQSAVS